MSALDYHVVDVFTDTRYAGNPLAVVLDADALDAGQMQAMAREFNLSESTFVCAPTAAADYRVRIFTPAAELPFAGHPSVGTAWVLRSLGRVGAGRVVQECGAGLLPLQVGDDEVELTGGTPTTGPPVDAADLVAAVGLVADDLAGTPPRWCGTGIEFAYLHVGPAALARCRPDLTRLAAVGGAGVSVFALDGDAVRARVFAGGVGVPEDPATGSAALGLGVFLVASGLLTGEGSSSYQVVQGVEMGRPSQLRCTVVAAGGVVTQARVAGGVVPVATGRITVP